MTKNVLTVEHFRKIYGDFVAVDNISFEVQRGEVFGLLGPNGAGKTSTLECLEGLRKPNSGKLNILGVDPNSQPQKLRNLIGVQLQTSGLPANMRVNEAMKFFCAYHDSEPRYDLIERLGLKEKQHNQYHELSTGQQRRLALALAVAHNPALLFLDEPTAGLDVASRTELHSLIRDLQAQGITVVLATHDMAEAEKIADRVAILLRGKIVATGSPRELTATGSGLTKVSVSSMDSCLHQNGTNIPGVQQHTINAAYAIYYSQDPGATVSALLDYIDKHADKLIDLRVERPSLEERFLEITTTGGAE